MIELDFAARAGLVEVPVAKHFPAQHPRTHGPAGQRGSMPRAPPALRFLQLIANFRLFVEIHQHQVRVETPHNRSLVQHVPDPCRRGAHPVHDLLQRTPSQIHLRQHQRQRIFHGRQAGGGLRIRTTLLFQRVRRVIGGNHLDAPLQQRLPEPTIVPLGLHRRVHLNQGPEPRIVIHVEEQVMRTHFGRDQLMMIRQQFCLRTGRHVQHVKAMSMTNGQFGRAPRRNHRCEFVANPRMIGHASRGIPGGIGAHRRFILTVRTDRQCRVGEDPFQGLLVVDQQIAGARADEDLDPRGPAGGLKLCDIVGRGADIEPVVDEAPCGSQRQLLLQALTGHRVGQRIGHLEERRDTPFRTGPRCVPQILFVSEPRFAEMHLIVNDTRQQVQSGRVDRILGRDLAGRIDVRNPVSLDQDRRPTATLWQHHRRVLDQCFHEMSVLVLSS